MLPSKYLPNEAEQGLKEIIFIGRDSRGEFYLFCITYFDILVTQTRVFKIGQIFLNVGNREISDSRNFQTQEFHFFPIWEIGKLLILN